MQETGDKGRLRFLAQSSYALWILLAVGLVGAAAVVCYLISLPASDAPADSAPPPPASDTVDAGGNDNVNPVLTGTVLEVLDGSVLVEIAPDQAVTGQAHISTKGVSVHPVSALQKGDVVRVVYNGEVKETYPLQIDTVFAVYVEQKATTTTTRKPTTTTTTATTVKKPTTTTTTVPTTTTTVGPDSIEGSELERMSDEEFKRLVDRFTDPVMQSLFILDGNRYSNRLLASSDSAEDAVRECRNVRSGYADATVVECKVVYESDILYGVYIKWKVGDNKYRKRYFLSLKKAVADRTGEPLYGDKAPFKIFTDDLSQIERALLYYNACYVDGDDKVLDYELTSDEDIYTITIYAYDYFYLHEEYWLMKQTVTVDKASGDVHFSLGETIRTIPK